MSDKSVRLHKQYDYFVKLSKHQSGNAILLELPETVIFAKNFPKKEIIYNITSNGLDVYSDATKEYDMPRYVKHSFILTDIHLQCYKRHINTLLVQYENAINIDELVELTHDDRVLQKDLFKLLPLLTAKDKKLMNLASKYNVTEGIKILQKLAKENGTI